MNSFYLYSKKGYHNPVYNSLPLRKDCAIIATNTNQLKITGDCITILVSERLDANNTAQLIDDLKKYAGQTFSKVIFDCKQLVYVSSAGLRPFIFSKQKIVPNGEVQIKDAPEPVIRVIKMSGFDSFLTLCNEN